MRVLIIDGNKEKCDFYCAVLSKLGHTCFCAYTGTDAYKRIKDTYPPFDVCLCSIQVPEMDGFLLKKKLNNENNRLPIVFVSNKEIQDKELMLKGLAAIRFIPYPVTQEELIRVIDKAYIFNRHIRLRPEFLNPIAKLKLVVDGEKLEPDLLLSTSYTIGRSDCSDIKVFNRGCSREAAIIQRSYDEKIIEDSYYSIVDYSRNGVTVNGKKINSFKQLQHGDIIKFAGFEAEYLSLKPFPTHDPKSTLV